MVTKPPSAHGRRAFRWRLLLAVLGLIVLDHFLAPAQAAPPPQAMLMASTAAMTVTGPLR